MPIPQATQTIRDNALGLVNTDADRRNVKMGVSSAGTVNTLYEFSDPKSVQDALGYGPLVEAICYALAQPNAGPILAIRLTSSVAGAAGSVTRSGTGTSVLVVSGAALDDFQGLVDYTAAGTNLAGATAQFRYSLDGGDNWSSSIAVPAGGTYVIPNTGHTLTWTDGTFVLGDRDSWTSTAPGYSATNVNAGFVALLADPREWGFIHLVGSATTVAGAVTIMSAVDTQMTTAEAAFLYGFAIVELPQDTDTNIITGTASFSSRRISPAAGFEELTSTISGRSYKRHAAWAYAARLGSITVQRHPGVTADGSLPGVGLLYRDEEATPGLDAARITTLRTIKGQSGKFITRGRIIAPAGSDFDAVQRRRVMDKACRLTRARTLLWLNRDLKVDRLTGYLTKDEIAAIQNDVTSFLRAGLRVGAGENSEASDVTYVVTPNNPILSNQTLYGKLRVLPKAYAEWIDTELGFTNPALQLV